MTETTTPVVGALATVEVKSKWTSKTNITAILLTFFGLLTATGHLPAAVATPEAVGGIVAAGGVLVAFFRTISNALRK